MSNQHLCLERQLILMCRKTTECVIIYIYDTLSNIMKPCWHSLSTLRVLCVNFLGFLYTRSFMCEQRNFYFFFNLMTFIYFSCLIALLRTFNMMLNKVDILVLYLSFRENFQSFTIKDDLGYAFLINSFYYLEKVSFYLKFCWGCF